jgi:hypothetical protein
MDPNSSTPSTEDATTALTDLALAVRAAVEDRDVKRLGDLFSAAPLLCISGRFLTKDEALRRLASFFKQIDQVSMELTRPEEQDVSADSAFGSYGVDFHWTDTSVWEERNASGVMSVTARRSLASDVAGGARREEWRMIGFAYTPRAAEPADLGLTRGIGPSGWAANVVDAAYGPLNIWR